jgi:Zn-finger nucleic acid-binding protein
MNCGNCGAPLTPVEGRDYFRCTFCATCHFPQKAEGSPDAIIPLSQPGDCECPLCAQALRQGAIEGYTIQYCEDCRGLLTTNEAFPAILRKRRAAMSGKAEALAPLNRAELARRLDCPRCRQRMETHPYHGGGNAVIDTCMRCQLIWFDCGELASLARAVERRPRPPEETLFSRFVRKEAAEGFRGDGLFTG